MDYITTLMEVYTGHLPDFVDKMDSKLETTEKEQVETIFSEFSKLAKSGKNVHIIAKAVVFFESLENFQKWVEHPIYINEFKDKKGNKYLQGRTSIKNVKGKTTWVSAYIGSMKEYPKGVNDPNAMEKAKPLIRMKLKKYFGIK